MLEVKTIPAEDTYEIRNRILRPHQSIEQCKYDQDHAEGSFHLGAFFEETLISIASFSPENQPLLTDSPAYRLRGMATLEEYRDQKAGSTLIKYAEQKLADMGVQAVWCNARYHVKSYYEKLGWKELGEPFEISGIGTHIVMYKKTETSR
ncbi:GNAT family N-acetyltransferase [Bacillus mojavensis]|uniref:GNAT family N-acetyltransferase n=1 Tax=Bacillus mojavensis TaxID=72360 RepID=UPI002DB72353|nr:GNAT family N-acetyltransferase [Bacillus mojavensis]MEC1678235.1 GNAT family N-acetyltransferase [Bacillus mojavensis]MEC1710507.1 GNAT family N-acetyltransferase [Bacillus mojavensis]